jgi:amino acid transporter
VIAHRVWGGLWFFALLAMFTSVIGASLACQNVATRMWYRMGQSEVLPKVVGTVHPVRKTPTVAIHIQFALSVLLGLVAAAIWGPDKIFVLTVGFVLVIGVIFVYVMANLGVVLYYWRERRQEFNWILHFVFPVGTSLILIYSLYASFNPFPASPYNLSPFIVGAWLIVGIGILIGLKLRGNEEWLQKAGEIVGERRETPEELAHRSAI